MTADIEACRTKQASFIKIRCIITAMAVLCPIVCYIARQNLSMAIISIVNDENVSNNNNNKTQDNQFVDVCPPPIVTGSDGKETTAAKLETYGPRYDWDVNERSVVFQAFFTTYVLFQIPGARLSEIIGAKWILFTAAAGSSALSLISPWAIGLHVYVFSLVRALMGICQATLYPACYVLLTCWLPPAERSQALPMLGCGAFIGAMITSTATGFFSQNASFGWPYAFYMPGGLCAIWAALWAYIGASEPKQHRLISLEELDYIESKMEVKPSMQTKKQISWMKLLTSQHVWAFTLTFLASNWAFTIVLLQIPTYLSDILLLPLFKNGLVNSIFYLLFCVSSLIVGTVSTFMIETRPCGITRLQTRKIFQSIGVFSQTLCFIGLTYIGCDLDMALVILCVQVVLYSFISGGETQLPSDLSVDFAGTIYAIGNCVGSSTGVIVPQILALMVPHRNRAEWYIYFYLTSAITASGGLIFLIFGKNDMQDFSVDVCDVNESQVNICSMKYCTFDMEMHDPSRKQPKNTNERQETIKVTITLS